MDKADGAIAKITTGKDKKEDMMLLLSSQANWDQFLTPAPLAISLLGELILISADTDFSLTEKTPADGFQFLRHPDSFRACLVQVSNEGWSAFNGAHTNMDQICLYSANVEKHVKNAVKFLIGGSTQEVEHMLPMSLEKVNDIAESCMELAKGIEDKFVRVMSLTGELLETCTAVKGSYEKKCKDTETALEIAKMQEEQVKRSREEMKERCNNLQKDMEEAQSAFKEAMSEIPSGMTALGLSLAEGLVNGVKGIVSIPSILPNTIQQLANIPVKITDVAAMTQAFTSSARNETSREEDNLAQKMEKYKAYSFAYTISPLLAELYKIATKGGKNGQQSPDLSAESRNGIAFTKQRLIKIEERVNDLSADTNPKETALKLCRKGIKICTSIESLCSFTGDEGGEKSKRIVEKATKLLNLAKEFEVQAKKKSGTNPLDTKPPNIGKIPEPSSGSGVLEQEAKAARFKTETAKEILLDSKQRHDEAYKAMREENARLEKIISEMATLKIDKVDFEAIRETLKKGIRTLADVREQWGKLVRFFQMMSNLIKCCLHTTLKDFVDYSAKGREIMSKNLPLSATFRDLIFEQASQANRVAYAVQIISGTYVTVSNKHLMDRVTKLGQLIALDSKSPDLQQKRMELHNGTQDAQRAIQAIMKKERQEFERKLEERINKIEKEVEAVLPKLPPKELEAIKQTVKSGCTKSEEGPDKEVDDLV